MIHISDECKKHLAEQREDEIVDAIYRTKMRAIKGAIGDRYRIKESESGFRYSLWVYEKIPFLSLLSYARRIPDITIKFSSKGIIITPINHNYDKAKALAERLGIYFTEDIFVGESEWIGYGM